MDGYVRYADLAHGELLHVAQRCYGDTPAPLARARPHASSPAAIPPGADTVVMQEHARERDGWVAFDAPQRRGSHIRRQARRAGDRLVPAGVRMPDARRRGRRAGFARRRTPGAARRPPDDRRRAVACGQPRAPQQIYDSNAPMLAALVAGTGAEVAMRLHGRHRTRRRSCCATCTRVATGDLRRWRIGRRQDLLRPRWTRSARRSSSPACA